MAGVTGLSAASVSNIVKELSTSGVLHTSRTTQNGRRAQYVTLAHALGLIVGVHFSRRHMRIALTDVAQTVVAENHVPLAKDHRADNELDRVARMVADMLESVSGSLDEVRSVGIALPTSVDSKTGMTARSGLLRGWDGVPVADVLSWRLGRPVFVDNAANLAALAEHRSGASRGRADSVYLDIGDGISAGLIINGQLFRGFSGGAGEFGHTVIRDNGPLCACGTRGCLEAIAGGAAVLSNLRESHGAMKLTDVVVRAIAGDAGCAREIVNAGRSIGVAAANLCNLIAPERLVIGGELARAGELLIGPIRHAVERAVLVSEGSLPNIVPAELGERSAVLGAVVFAIDQLSVTSAEIVA
nr:ROK family protein [Leifsonia psychrotolerans]